MWRGLPAHRSGRRSARWCWRVWAPWRSWQPATFPWSSTRARFSLQRDTRDPRLPCRRRPDGQQRAARDGVIRRAAIDHVAARRVGDGPAGAILVATLVAAVLAGVAALGGRGSRPGGRALAPGIAGLVRAGAGGLRSQPRDGRARAAERPLPRVPGPDRTGAGGRWRRATGGAAPRRRAPRQGAPGRVGPGRDEPGHRGVLVAVLVAIGVSAWPPVIAEDGGWRLADQAARGSRAARATRPWRSTGSRHSSPRMRCASRCSATAWRCCPVKRTDPTASPARGWRSWSAIRCSTRSWAPRAAARPRTRGWGRLPGGASLRLVERFDAGPRRVISVYAADAPGAQHPRAMRTPAPAGPAFAVPETRTWRDVRAVPWKCYGRPGCAGAGRGPRRTVARRGGAVDGGRRDAGAA